MVFESARIERILGHVRALLADLSPHGFGQDDAMRRRLGRPLLGDLVRYILLSVGAPVHRRELVELVASCGFRAGPAWGNMNSVSALLTRDERFQPMGGAGCWGLSEWDEEVAVDGSVDFLVGVSSGPCGG